MFDDDLGVFYDPADFAVRCTRTRPGEDDAQFNGILAVVDEALFDGHVTAGMHVLQYPAAAASMLAGDEVATVATNAAGVEQPALAWRVLRSAERVVDGAEARVYLQPLPEL